MPVVSNTSPILNLAVVNHLDLLKQQFGKIFVPPTVVIELKLQSDYPGTKIIQQALDAEWIQVVELQNDRVAQILMLELDQGEAAAIALALELSHSLILIDERDGRAKATALGLQPIGILGILLQAKFSGIINSIEDIITDLRHKAGFFIADDLLEAILIEADER